MSNGPEVEYTTPLPAAIFFRYIRIWHYLMLASLAVGWASIVWANRDGPLRGAIAFTVVVLGQLVVYLLLVVHGPLDNRRERVLLVYFATSLAIWYAGYRIYSEYWWFVFTYVGQMFGMLRTRYAIPGYIIGTALIADRLVDWEQVAAHPEQIRGVVGQWLTFLIIGVFISDLATTSQERGELIRELEAAKSELEESRSREAELAVLRERTRLARDLHDSMGHSLVALSVQLEAVQRLYRVDPKAASDRLDDLKALTRSSMETLRRSVAGLRAPGLGDRSLREAMQELCHRFGQRTGIDVTCQLTPGVDALRPALAETAWRLTQEALTNVEKHAQATAVEIELSMEPHGALLTIRDDGVGLPDDAEARPGRYGLQGMRERVEGLGGTLELGGERGAQITARLPVVQAGEIVSDDIAYGRDQ